MRVLLRRREGIVMATWASRTLSATLKVTSVSGHGDLGGSTKGCDRPERQQVVWRAARPFLHPTADATRAGLGTGSRRWAACRACRVEPVLTGPDREGLVRYVWVVIACYPAPACVQGGPGGAAGTAAGVEAARLWERAGADFLQGALAVAIVEPCMCAVAWQSREGSDARGLTPIRIVAGGRGMDESLAASLSSAAPVARMAVDVTSQPAMDG